MIKLYVFISGLALFRFIPTADPSQPVVQVYFPTTAAHPHGLSALLGTSGVDARIPATQDQPIDWSIEGAPCAAGCGLDGSDVDIPDLRDFYESAMTWSPDCGDPAEHWQCPSLGRISLIGRWRAAARTFCGVDPFPEDKSSNGRQNFIGVAGDEGGLTLLPTHASYGTGVQFSTDITQAQLEHLPEAIRQSVSPTCDGRRDFRLADYPGGCAMVAIVNGAIENDSDHPMHDAPTAAARLYGHDALEGAADLHFDSLFELFCKAGDERCVSAKRKGKFLPISAPGDMTCVNAGAGTWGSPGCTGGKIQ